MPLAHGKSAETFSTNVSEMMHAGHPQDQALAAAYRMKRQSRAAGGGLGDHTVRPMRWSGDVLDAAHPADGSTRGKVPGFALGGAPAPWQVRSEAKSMMHTGPIMSAVPGRTDRHNMKVGSGSYVVPAQAVSHLGQSNTIAGMKVLNSMFGHGGPYGAGEMGIKHGAGAPKPPKPMKPFAAGGWADTGGARGDDESGAPVDVVTAGGEFVIPPESVAAVGGGDVKHGHNVLDAWINSLLDDHIKTLKKLPPPAKS